MVIKLSKTELNEILKYIREDDECIGLLCDLMYIYARNITEVSTLKKEDINFKENYIKFKINQNNTIGIYPIHKDLKNRLLKFLETDNEYIFEDYLYIYNPTNYINGYLSKHNGKFKNLIYKNKVNLSLSSIDFKILRGQHLFLDGVSLESIHKLYHYKNINSTKRIINYNQLIIKKEIDLEELILNFTDMNIYTTEDYKIFNQYICSYNNKESIVLFDKMTEEYIISGDAEIQEKIKGFNFNILKESGEYTVHNKVNILKI